MHFRVSEWACWQRRRAVRDPHWHHVRRDREHLRRRHPQQPHPEVRLPDNDGGPDDDHHATNDNHYHHYLDLYEHQHVHEHLVHDFDHPADDDHHEHDDEHDSHDHHHYVDLHLLH